MGFAEFIIGPAHRVRPLAGPMAGSGRTRWLNLSYAVRRDDSRLEKHCTRRHRPQVIIPIPGDASATPERWDLSVTLWEPDHVDARANLDGDRSAGRAGEAVGVGACQTGGP